MTTKLEPVRDPAEADVLDRIGVILTGLRAIGRYMGVSAMTILRWHECYRGRTEAWLCFPLMMFPTGKGWGLTYKAHTGLIADWMQRWSDIDARAKRPRKSRKMLQMGVTEEGLRGRSTEGRDETAIHEEGLALPEKKPCPCGVPNRCLVHDDPLGEAGPSIDEEPAKLTPVNQEVTNPALVTPELTPALGVKLPEKHIPEGCTCGTATHCSVCNG
jgi:hypothetical protein